MSVIGTLALSIVLCSTQTVQKPVETYTPFQSVIVNNKHSFKNEVNVGGQHIITLRCINPAILAKRLEKFENFLRNLPTDTFSKDFHIRFTGVKFNERCLFYFRDQIILEATQEDADICQMNLADYAGFQLSSLAQNVPIIAPRSHGIYSIKEMVAMISYQTSKVLNTYSKIESYVPYPNGINIKN